MNKKITRKNNGRKGFLSLALILVLIFCLQTAVFAANTGTQPGNVLTINTALNVTPDSDGNDDDYSEHDTYIYSSAEAAWVWHPISVINEPMNGFNAIRRTYALPPYVNPAVISTADFEMFGQRFSFAYVLQQSTMDESFMEVRETVTIEARSRNLNDILPNLEQEIWFERDGFAGTLTLDIHSITSEVAGTSRHTTTATRQRTFPHLSSPDNSLIPRTIIDGGTTFHLSTVEWQSGGTSAVDGHPVASSHTATATFTAQVTQTRTTGYVITAEYVGTVFRTAQGKTLFTAIFYGEPIVEIWLQDNGANNTAGSQSEGGDGAGYANNTNLNHGEGSENQGGSGYGSNDASASSNSSSNPNQSYTSGSAAGDVVSVILSAIGILVGLIALGIVGLLLAKRFLGFNTTIYSIDSPREIVKAGKIKIDTNSPEPVISLDKAVGRNLAKTDRYIIQIAQRAVQKLVNKEVRIVLHDKEAFHKVPENALNVPVYEFEVNFSDDDDTPLGAAATDEIDRYSSGGDA